MKNKLYIIGFIAALFAILILFTKPQTPYCGKYYPGSTNEELVLNRDNSFDLNISGNRTSITIRGKYSIINNHIELVANNKNDRFYIDTISSGDVMGSVITFKQVKNGSSIIFTKS